VANYYYVKSGGTAQDNGANDGRYTSQITSSGFADAFTDDWGAKGFAAADDYYYESINDCFLTAGITVPVSGDIIVISDASAFTYASGDITIDNNLGGTNSDIPVVLISVDDAAVDTYSEATAAQEKSLGTGDDLTFKGHWAMYGVWLEAGQNILFQPDSSEGIIYCKNCTLVVDDGESVLFGLGFAGSVQRMQSCKLDWAADAASTTWIIHHLGGMLEMQDTLIGVNRASSTGQMVNTQQSGGILMSGTDFTSQPTGYISTAISDELSCIQEYVGIAIATGATVSSGGITQYPDVIVRSVYADFDGVEDDYDTMYGICIKQADVKRTGGSDHSWKITTKVSASERAPFYTPWITGYFDSTAAKTVDIYIGTLTTTDGGDYNNDELWIECEYFINSGNPLYGFYTTARVSPLATAVDPYDATDSSTWTGTGNPNAGSKHILRAAVTPGQVGPFRCRLGFGRASVSTDPLFVDPFPVIT